jgi:8-oxo-dGTP pyrophosphatase MutT (NUDIX family)
MVPEYAFLITVKSQSVYIKDVTILSSCYNSRMEAIPQFASIHLVLPDGRAVLQRRTPDARFGAGLLGTFGGGVEVGETSRQCIEREVGEETSLELSDIGIEFAADFVMPPSDAFPQGRHFHLFRGRVENLGFAVYEGVGAEAYAMDELASREDLVSSARHLFQVMPALLD